MKTLNFLDDFWSRAKKAIEEIEEDLPKVIKEDILKPIGTSGKMWTIQYKDLGDKWGVNEILQRHNGESNTLTLLTHKVRSVFEKSPDKVVEFLVSTANKGYFINKMNREEKIVLSPNELTRLKLYIHENL